MSKYQVMTVLCRSYVTIVLAVMAAVGAETWLAAIGALSIGVMIDLLRNKYSPDLAQPPTTTLAELMEPKAYDPNAKPLRVWNYMYAGIVVYVILIAHLDWLVGIRAATFYLGLFQLLHDGVGTLVAAIPRNTLILEAKGFSYRALLAAHIYSVSIAFIILGLPFAVAANQNALKMKSKDESRRRGYFEVRLHSLQAIVFYALTFALYITIANFVSPDTQSKRFPWNIAESNGPYIIMAMWTVALSMFLVAGYSYLIRVRLRQLLFTRHGPA